MNKPHFDTPTQVMFHDIDEPGSWITGIAFGDTIICACCGGVYDIDEVCELSEGYVDQAIYPYNTWVDLSAEIFGGEFPKGLVTTGEGANERIVEESFLESEEYEQYSFILEEEEETQARASEI